MRRIIITLITILLCVTLWPDDVEARGRGGRSYSSGGTVSVRGYTRKDGTYVRPHTRSAPSSSYWPAAGISGAAYLPYASSTPSTPLSPPVVPEPIKYASPSSALVPVVGLAPPEPPTPKKDECPRKGWCYIVTRADGVIEAGANAPVDISYPPAPNTPPYRALIYNNQQ